MVTTTWGNVCADDVFGGDLFCFVFSCVSGEGWGAGGGGGGWYAGFRKYLFQINTICMTQNYMSVLRERERERERERDWILCRSFVVNTKHFTVTFES